ncbi:UNVERIFIED_CONTAM: hypothetical protein Sradi_6454600 [Sesamum radiatum]|uniref:Reverse transcriptase domain-containing protein n=1 Tax=Sesamum radiatum TaxID=300843 RepID=A0AAW2K7B7_SESRA
MDSHPLSIKHVWNSFKDILEPDKDFLARTPIANILHCHHDHSKTDSPQTWSDFKPISLCNVINKIMTKLLYNKMAHLLPTLISPSQSGFVPGRLIGDNILMA